LDWQGPGDAPGTLQVAFPVPAGCQRGDWVLMRVAGDGDKRVLVFDRNEWECFLDGVGKGEFGDLLEPSAT
jgi:hypothetical protein